jgi:hypothetical protein
MLPTQFTPEYYRDAKDILWAQGAEENQPKARRPRRSPFLFVRRLFGRLAHKPEGKEVEPAPSAKRFSH